MTKKSIKVLISDKLAQEGIDILKQTPGIEVTVNTGFAPAELKHKLNNYDAIIIRSATKLTAEVLEAAPNLKAICRAGVGVDNVDIPAASKNGTIVMNTPGGNTTSTAELAITLLLSLCRNIAPASTKLKNGEWDKKSFKGTEVNGKTIGILGLGRIGCEMVKRCLGMQIKVLGYDPFMSEERAEALGIKLYSSVRKMVKYVDFISVHTPLNDETRGIIGKEEFALMPDGVRVVNDARGGIIDEEALLEALESDKCAGAALDVYTKEPPEDRRLIDHPKVLCTPHLGASTDEAQVSVAIDAANQIVDALKNNNVHSALNYPELPSQDEEMLTPYSLLALKLGSFAGQFTEGQIKSITLSYAGEIASRDLRGVTMQFTMGLMSCFEEGVNPISAPLIAKERGLDIKISKTEKTKDYQSLITVAIVSSNGSHKVAGTIFGKKILRIVMVDDFYVEVAPEGTLLLLTNHDKPGVIGTIGTTLGNAGANIATMTWGRKGSEAVSVVGVDKCEIKSEVLQLLAELKDVTGVRMVKL